MFIVENFKTILMKQYADFQGRASRSEFWYFILASFIVAIVLGIVDGIIGAMILAPLFNLAILIPTLAVTARRLHDIGKSGWWQLIGIIPLVGFIVMIVFLVTDSNSEGDKYGANPKV